MEAKLAPKMPQWMVDHANKYLSSGGAEGHIYKIKPPNYGDLEVPSLLLTTTGRKSGERFIFPLFYGDTGNGYFVIASKGGAPKHPSWYLNILANPDVEVQVGTAKMKARARTATGEERARLWKKSLERSGFLRKAEIDYAGNGRPALRWDVNPALIGVALAETAETPPA